MFKDYERLKRRWVYKVPLLALMLLICTLAASAQERTLTGTITSDEGEALPGANVLVKGTSEGTISDIDGKYSLSIPENATISYSMVGYISEEVAIGNQSVVDIVLAVDITQLDEIVITGYSSQSRSKVTNSIVTVDAEPLQNIPAGGNALNSLIGKVSGVVVLQSDGRSGSAPSIQIRGGTTPGFGGDTPLYIVDGFIQDDIGAIDMNDVEEFTILKDASATAIYGAQAANGVIIVNTRKGKRGKFNIQFKYGHEYQNVDRYKVDVLTPEEEGYYMRMQYLGYEDPLAYQFISGRSQWYSAVQPFDPSQPGYVENNASQMHWLDDVLQYNGGVLPDGWHQTVDPVTGRQLAFPVNDWQDATFTDGNADSYFLNVGGGTEKAIYSVSMSYYDQKGIGVFNNYSRLYLNANSEIELSKRVRTGFNFNYSLEDEDRGEGNSWYERGGRQTITTRLWNDDGTPAPNFKNSGKYNPEYYENNLQRTRINTNIRLNAFLEWEITDGLIFKPSVLLKQGTNSYASFIPENLINGAKRNQQAWIVNELNTQFNGILTYDKVFNNVHSLNVLAGTEFRNGYEYLVNGTGFGASSDLIPTINSSLPNENTTVVSQFTTPAIQSWFGQVSYDYDMRYLLNATLRYDGSYKFTEENQWGLFPGISAGWNLHNENFWGGLGLSSWFKKAKLKAAYGEAGKSAGLSINDTQGAYSTVSYANVGGVLQSNLQNTALVWETTREWGGGLEMTFLQKSNLNASVEYYNKSAVDRLFSEPLPSFTGFSGITTNIGTFESRGIEIAYNARIINTDRFSWDINGFFDFLLSQETLKLPDNGAENNRISGFFVTNPDDPTGDPILVGGFAEGERWGAVYGYVNEGVIQNWDEADAYNERVYDEVSASSRNKRQFKKPGDYMWADLNGDGLVNSHDRAFKGWSTPDKRIGLTSSFQYKTSDYGNLRLSFTLESSLGAVADDWHTMRMIAQAQGGDRPSVVVRDSWLEEGDALFASYTWANRHTAWNYERVSEPFVQSTDYIALRNIEFNYTFPTSLVNKIGVADLEVFVAGQHLGFLTEYKGPDPSQVDGRDNIRTVPPAPKTFKFGVNVTF